MAVVQLGLAMSFLPEAVFWLISGTTSGTAPSMRNADELSITTGPFYTQHREIFSKWRGHLMAILTLCFEV
jgi:hypothetical protein